MKLIFTTLIFVIIVGMSQTAYSQFYAGKSFGGTWTYTEIKGADSLQPVKLIFIDSVHGLLACVRTHFFWPWYDPVKGKTSVKTYWYITDDGGTTWNAMKFTGTGYSDSTIPPIGNYSPTIIYTKNSKSLYAGYQSYTFGDTGINYFKYDMFKMSKSQDYGSNWSGTEFLADSPSVSLNYNILGTLSANTLLMLQDRDSGKLAFSTNYGKTFDIQKGDGVLKSVVVRSDTDNVGRTVKFDNSDILYWTLTAQSNWSDCDKSRNGCGLITLLTSNAGATWAKHQFKLPGFEDKVISGVPQFIKGTSHLYYFTHADYSFVSSEGEVNRFAGTASQYNQFWYFSESCNNTSFLHSSDYGKTWSPVHNYGERRRAYEAVDVGHVWMTVSRENDIHSPNTIARVIVRTTDNGITWEEDSSTLSLDDVAILDGRILTFSDTRHGWIAAKDGHRTFILKWVADSKNIAEGNLEDETFRIKLYPNPSVGESNILLPSKRSVRDVQLYDTFGRKQNVEYVVKNNSATLATRNFPAGCYYLKVVNDRGATYIRTLIITR
jgi:hypothetical protein